MHYKPRFIDRQLFINPIFDNFHIIRYNLLIEYKIQIKYIVYRANGLNERRKKLINKIRYLRKELKISQNKLACKANIDLRYLQRIEKGEQIPTVYIALSIAKALNTTVEILFNHLSI